MEGDYYIIFFALFPFCFFGGAQRTRYVGFSALMLDMVVDRVASNATIYAQLQHAMVGGGRLPYVLGIVLDHELNAHGSESILFFAFFEVGNF